MSQLTRLFVLAVFSSIFFVSCGRPPVVATTTPVQPRTPMPLPCAPPSGSASVEQMAAWTTWDGAERSYPVGDTTYHIRLENKTTVVIDITPADRTLPRQEFSGIDLQNRQLVGIPIATNVNDKYYLLRGPILLYRCEQVVWLNEFDKDKEEVIPIATTQSPQG